MGRRLERTSTLGASNVVGNVSGSRPASRAGSDAGKWTPGSRPSSRGSFSSRLPSSKLSAVDTANSRATSATSTRAKTPLSTRQTSGRENASRILSESVPGKKGRQSKDGNMEASLQVLRNKLYHNSTDVRKAFRKMDKDKDGSIQADEFMDGLRDLSLGLSEEQLSDIVSSFDFDGSGEVDFNEFVYNLKLNDLANSYNAFALERPIQPPPPLTEKISRDQLTRTEKRRARRIGAMLQSCFETKFANTRGAFRCFDINRDSCISHEELADQASRLFHIKCEPDDVKNLMTLWRTENPGFVTYSDFNRVFRVPDKTGQCHAFSGDVMLRTIDTAVAQRPSTAERKAAIRESLEKARPKTANVPGSKKWTLPKEVQRGDQTGMLRLLREKGFVSRAHIGDLFRKFHLGKGGTGSGVTPEDIRRGMDRLGLPLPLNEVKKFVEKYDLNKDGELDYREFVDGLVQPNATGEFNPFEPPCDVPDDVSTYNDPTPRSTHPLALEWKRTGKVPVGLLRVVQERVWQNKRNVRDVFRSFDWNKDGVVTRGEFKKGIRNLNLGLHDQLIDKLVDAFDSDGNGELDYNEFVACLKQTDTSGHINMFLQERTIAKKAQTFEQAVDASAALNFKTAPPEEQEVRPQSTHAEDLPPVLNEQTPERKLSRPRTGSTCSQQGSQRRTQRGVPSHDSSRRQTPTLIGDAHEDDKACLQFLREGLHARYGSASGAFVALDRNRDGALDADEVRIGIDLVTGGGLSGVELETMVDRFKDCNFKQFCGKLNEDNSRPPSNPAQRYTDLSTRGKPTDTSRRMERRQTLRPPSAQSALCEALPRTPGSPSLQGQDVRRWLSTLSRSDRYEARAEAVRTAWTARQKIGTL